MELKYDDEIKVWSLSPESACAFFGLDPSQCEVRVLKDGPENARELERYSPKAKLFGIKEIKA